MADERTTFDRMGYPNIISASSFGSEPDTVEIALVGPGLFGVSTWAVVTHVGCDPDDPVAGSSGVETFAVEADARKAYASAVSAAAREARQALGRVGEDLVPDLADDDVMAARDFFAALEKLGATFHADDDPYDIIDASGRRLFTDAAAKKVESAIGRLRAACQEWPDPDFLYSLAGQGTFAVERDYPGFVMDTGIPGCIGLGYPSLPGQDYPTLLSNDAGFVAIQAIPGKGPISQSEKFRVIPVDGISFGSDGSVDVSAARLRLDEAREAETIFEAVNLAEEVGLSGGRTAPTA